METIIFLCNCNSNPEFTDSIKTKIALGNYRRLTWSCGNSKFIKVGDKAYFQKTGSVGNELSGFIAAGRVIAASENKQLRLRDRSNYGNLSAAYSDVRSGIFYVRIEIDSVVNFEVPLEQKYLKTLPEFREVNFNFQGGGCRFDKKAASSLDSEWDKHSLIQQRQNKGRRLVDIFVERGNIFKQNKEYQTAIETYELALKILPNYSKAINQINDCKSILNRVNKSNSLKELIVNEQNNELILAREELDKSNFFDFESDVDARQKITFSIARRQGQSKFREALLTAYCRMCAITKFDAEAALEAAHIIPYIQTENNEPSNGLLLRADLHTLFDLNLIIINPDTLQVHIHPELQKTEYRTIDRQEIRVPMDKTCRPKKEFLKERFEKCKWLKNV